jgi:hypothetical protein
VCAVPLASILSATLVRRFPSQSIRRAAFVAGLVLVLSSRAAAQDQPMREKFRLEYRAPPECPDGERFKGLVGGRLPDDWEAPPGELAPRVDVVVTGTPSSYVAIIEFFDGSGHRVTREVHGAFCPDVVEGIALVTALAIQSREETALDETAPESTGPASESPPPALTTRPAAAPEARAAVPTTTRRAAPEPRDVPPPVRLRASARAAVATGIGPEPAAGAGIGVVLERRTARLGAAIQGFWTGRVDAAGVPAHFELFAARLEGCPFAPELTRTLSLEPCVFVEVGSLTGEAYEAPPEVVRGFPGSALWLSTGGAIRAVGRFGAFIVELEGLLGVSLRRELFTLEEGDELHHVPPFYGAAAVGLGVVF